MLRYVSQSLLILISIIFIESNVCAQVMTPVQPNNKLSETKKAHNFYRERQFERALEIYLKLYEEKKSLSYYSYVLNCYIGLGEYKEAQKIVKDRRKLNPGDYRYEVDAAWLEIQSGKTEKGKKKYEKLIESVPANVSKIKNLAQAFGTRGEYQLSVRTYEKGRELLKNKKEYSLELGLLYGQTGKWELMFDELLEALLTNQKRIGTVKSRFRYYFRQNPQSDLKEMFEAKLIRRLQKYPDKRVYADLMYWFAIQEKDFESALTQAQSLDRRYNEDGRTLYSLAQVCVNNSAYNYAEKALQAIVDKGREFSLYKVANSDLIKVRYILVTNRGERDELSTFEGEIIKVLDDIGRSTLTFDLVRHLAQLQAYHLDSVNKGIETMTEGIKIRGLRKGQYAQGKIDLGDMYILANDPWEAILLYAQAHDMLRDDPIGHEAKLRHAKVSYYLGEFGWAQNQLNALKAATSKLIANDAIEISVLIQSNMLEDSIEQPLRTFARADLELFKMNYDTALFYIDSLSNMNQYHDLGDDALYKKAEILIAMNKFEDADLVLIELIEKYPHDMWADNALYKRMELYRDVFMKEDETIQLLKLLMTEYKGSVYSDEARKIYREMIKEVETDSEEEELN